MTITQDQRTHARLAALMIIANYVLQGFGDSVTIIGRNGETFVQTARFAADHMVLWRACLLSVGLAWIAIGVYGFALYVVLEPVSKRLAQLALVLRLGASFVGAASLMLRVAQARLYSASKTEGLFTIDQLRTLVATAQRAASEGVETAWIFQGLGALLFFVLFLRSGYLPRALAVLGIVTAVLFLPAPAVMFVFPQWINGLKLVGLPAFAVDVALASWLLAKGLPRSTTEARA